LEVSNKFRFIENNLVKLFSLIYANPIISKYIYYLNDDPQSMPDVPIDLMENGNYFLNLFDGNITEEYKIRLFLNPVLGNFSKQPLSDITYLLEIVVPNKYMVLNGRGELRCILILDEISQMID
jgi:hypothetical protein